MQASAVVQFSWSAACLCSSGLCVTLTETVRLCSLVRLEGLMHGCRIAQRDLESGLFDPERPGDSSPPPLRRRFQEASTSSEQPLACYFCGEKSRRWSSTDSMGQRRGLVRI